MYDRSTASFSTFANDRREVAVHLAEKLADGWFRQPETSAGEPPHAALAGLRTNGLLFAPLHSDFGGLGLGTEAGGQLALLRVLTALGGADLALGRLYEGHVNALILIQTYGSSQQITAAADAAHAGMLFGVWNTGEPRPMHIDERNGDLALKGCKTFATGAAFVQRPIVTAERNGWQMTLPRMEAPEVAAAIRLDRESWHPLGMEGSESLTIDFTGVPLSPGDLVGRTGDFYRDPLFRGGAIRFAAVQTGAVARLAQAFGDWIMSRGRQSDPYQIARLGEIELLAQGAVLWIERAAAVAELCMTLDATERESKQMVRFANMTRLAVQHSATSMMTHVVSGVGAHGLLRPARFERIVRDLTMYLRQPNPDGTLADVGRSALLENASGYWAGAASTSTE